MAEETAPPLLIGVVGPCGAGKSTLTLALRSLGYRCRHIAQEHSYVPSMWQKLAKPDVLIYLEASFDVCTSRRQLNWTQAEYLEQLTRLAHARQHAQLVLQTDGLSAGEVLSRAQRFLREVSGGR